MASKALKKKKAWKAFCRRQVVKEGLVNDEAGRWIRASETSGIGKNMHRDMLAGYRAGRRAK